MSASHENQLREREREEGKERKGRVGEKRAEDKGERTDVWEK